MRCVDDMTLPLDVRAAGALVLLYGVPVSRIAQLTLQDIEEREDGTYIALGARPILMPPVVADLVAQQAAALPRSIAARTIDGTDWLFPGNLAGRPTTAMPLTRRLSTHGISVRPARNTAVLALAADLPATILSDVLGMHIVTAVDWVKYVKRDWTGYIEAKAADRHNQQEGM
ncbi:Cro/Cl family transcriptional regulator [Streptomyces sp. KO7888]|nr:Cro/Cl family transcriptional regulator [Streptomyces sp. KO7888]